MRHLNALLVTLLFTAAAAAQDTTFTPRQWLGVAVIPAADGDYDRAIADARGLGMGYTELSLQWDDLEPAPGGLGVLSGGGADADWLSIANTYYPAIDLPLMLCINPIDTSRRRTPADLDATAWDDPALLARFVALLDHVAAQTSDLKLVGLSLGNEVDALLAEDTDAWAAYTRFFVAAQAHAHTLWPGVPVGVKLTAGGLLEGGPEATTLAATGDAVMVNYYPLTSAFGVETPAAVRRTLARLVAASDDQPLWFTELGCPSGRACGGNESTQAEFFKDFGRWRTPRAAQVQRVCVTWLNDIGDAAADTWAGYYGVPDPAFRAYLATLGVQRHDGSPKQAVREIRRWR